MIKKIVSLSINPLSQVFFKPSFCFAAQSETNSKPKNITTFPYVFGGSYKQGQFENDDLLQQYFRDYFPGKDVLKDFKQSYRSLLHSLASNDIQTLKSTFEPNLLKDFTPQQVRLLNPDAEIQLACVNGYQLLYGTFIRDPNDEFTKVISDEQKGKMYDNRDSNANLSIFCLDHYSNMKKISISFFKPLSVLMAFEIVFKSQMKLVPISEHTKDHQNTEEYHSVQFEFEYSTSFWKSIKKSIIKQKQTFDHQILGENFKWKVGDVDRCLGGNMRLLS